MLPNVLTDRDVLEAEVVGVGDSAVHVVGDTGSAYAYPLHVVNGYTRVLAGFKADFSHVVRDLLCGTGAKCLCFRLADNFKAFVHHARLDVCSAEVNANVVLHKNFSF